MCYSLYVLDTFARVDALPEDVPEYLLHPSHPVSVFDVVEDEGLFLAFLVKCGELLEADEFVIDDECTKGLLGMPDLNEVCFERVVDAECFLYVLKGVDVDGTYYFNADPSFNEFLKDIL